MQWFAYFVISSANNGSIRLKAGETAKEAGKRVCGAYSEAAAFKDYPHCEVAPCKEFKL